MVGLVPGSWLGGSLWGKFITITKKRIRKKSVFQKPDLNDRPTPIQSNPSYSRLCWGPADVGPALQMVHASGGDTGVMLSWSFSPMAFKSLSLFCLLCGKVLEC